MLASAWQPALIDRSDDGAILEYGDQYPDSGDALDAAYAWADAEHLPIAL